MGSAQACRAWAPCYRDRVILPSRPLVLRPEYVRTARKRIAILSSFAILALLAASLSVIELQQIAELERAWAEGEAVDVISLDIIHRSMGPSHAYGSTIAYRDGVGERVAFGPRFTIPGGLPESVTEVLEVRRERGGTRLVPLFALLAAPIRARWASATMAVLVTIAGVLVLWARRRARELALVRAAAASSEELLVERAPGETRRRIAFVAPLPAAAATYRSAASPRRVTIDYRLREDEPPPLWVDEARARAVALRPDPRSSEVVVVREDLWPFQVSDAERGAIAVRIAATLRTADAQGAGDTSSRT